MQNRRDLRDGLTIFALIPLGLLTLWATAWMAIPVFTYYVEPYYSAWERYWR
jgi:hypothetical protein